MVSAYESMQSGRFVEEINARFWLRHFLVSYLVDLGAFQVSGNSAPNCLEVGDDGLVPDHDPPHPSLRREPHPHV